VAKKMECNVKEVKNVLLWGNHANTMVPDIGHCLIGSRKLSESLEQDPETKQYFHSPFVSEIQ
jgi:malate/lactate dehydrogenase